MRINKTEPQEDKTDSNFVHSEVEIKQIKKINRNKRRHSKDWKKKNYARRKGERELKRRRKRKKRLKVRYTTGPLTPRNPNLFEVVEAPKNFSLINNTNEVILYFKNIGKLFVDRKQVEFNLKNIDNLTPDAIALLIAKVEDERFTRSLRVRGNQPEKKILKRIFEESGFLNYVSSNYNPPKNDNNLLLHQITHKKVHPELAKKVSELAVKHTFKKIKKFSPIYKIMIECMANTDNHASIVKEGVYDWWLFAYCNPKNNITSFTFLDLGIGIFNSNPVNSYKRKLLTEISNLTKISFDQRDNIKLIPKLFSGNIYTSRTKNKKRGQGLPSIKECSQNSNIKNFIIITNNVKIKLPELTNEILQNKFNGTLLYWELHP